MSLIPSMCASEPATPADHDHDTSSPSASSQPSKRVLACVRCQKRKIKCNRQFPCTNCNTSSVQCVPATLKPTPRTRRKRRFPERELLERIRKYEDLLRQNNIKFEPLHKTPTQGEVGGDESDNEQPESVSADKSERVYEAQYALFKKPSQDH